MGAKLALKSAWCKIHSAQEAASRDLVGKAVFYRLAMAIQEVSAALDFIESADRCATAIEAERKLFAPPRQEKPSGEA